MTERKLTAGQVVEIRIELTKGTTQKELARRYGVSLKLISDINKGYNYRDPRGTPGTKKQPPKGISNKDRRMLTDAQVRLVRKELAQGNQINKIAKMVNVSPASIKNIRDRITYKDVK
jgi:transposase